MDALSSDPVALLQYLNVPEPFLLERVCHVDARGASADDADPVVLALGAVDPGEGDTPGGEGPINLGGKTAELRGEEI